VRVLVRTVTAIASIALVVGVVLTWRLGGAGAWSGTLLHRLPWLFLLGTGSQASRFFRWHSLVIRRAPQLLIRDSVRIYLSGFALEMTPGRVGAFLKFSLLRRTTGVPEAETVGVLPVEAATEVLSFLLVALIGAVAGGYRLPSIGWGVVIAFVVLLAVALIGPVRQRFGGRGRFTERFPVVQAFLAGLLSVGGPQPLLIALLCSLAARSCEVLLFGIATAAVGLQLTPAGAALAWGASGLAGGLSLLPGGVGAAEGAIVATVLALGGRTAPALAAAVVSRIMTIWLWVPLGLACAVASTRREREDSAG
jgi:uncharacterized membrane protein YbhN (UPF0104 family)